MIVKFTDYEQITPAVVESLKEAFAASEEYVDGIFAKRGAKEWAESVAGLNALYLAMKETGIDVSSAVISRLKNGKPVFTELPYFFNISHSCGRAVCVLCEKEVGVDIEFIKKERSFDVIAENFFSDGEIARFRQAKNRKEEFYRIWTRKEALLKKSGTGIEYKKLKKIDTYDYSVAKFIEYKRGQYLTTICVDADSDE